MKTCATHASLMHAAEALAAVVYGASARVIVERISSEIALDGRAWQASVGHWGSDERHCYVIEPTRHQALALLLELICIRVAGEGI